MHELPEPVNPYQFINRSISGKWKLMILHYIHDNGYLRFNEYLKVLPISERILSQKLRELTQDGLIHRKQYDTVPLRVEYSLTPAGEALIPALEELYIWAVRRMYELGIKIDTHAFEIHTSEKFTARLGDIMEEYASKGKDSQVLR